MPRRRHGFSFAELLVVLALIGVLAGIAVPKIRELKRKSYVATLVTELRNLSNLQELHWTETFAYANAIGTVGYGPSERVTVTIVEASDYGWSATARHKEIAIACAVFYGTAEPLAPATSAGVIGCS